METEVVGSLSTLELRQALEQAKKDMDETPTYYNAVRVQHAQREYDVSVSKDRSEYFVIDGSNGLHSRTPLQIATDALAEIYDRSKALDAEFGYIINTEGRRPFYFLGSVAQQALTDIGE